MDSIIHDANWTIEKSFNSILRLHRAHWATPEKVHAVWFTQPKIALEMVYVNASFLCWYVVSRASVLI